MKDQDLQHLAAIVRDSDDAIIGKTLEGIITSWNGGAERIYGYTAEEAIGRTVAMLVPPDREDELPKILQKLSQGEGINHYDTLRVTKDGRLVNISLTVSPIRDASGAIIGASSIDRDVTKQKEAEDALRESARAYKLLMEQASDAILVSYPNQPLIEINQRASDMLGYTREELLQLHKGAGALPEDLRELPFGPEEILDGDIVYAERTVQRKDGISIVTELSTRRLDDGRIVTIARDITERKRTEEELRKREAQLSEAQEIAHVGSWEADIATGDVIWSDELYRIYGVPPQSHKASLEAFIEYVHPDDRELARREIEQANKKVGPFSYELRVQRPDGSVRVVCTNGKVIKDENGKPSRAIGTGQDITERTRAEEALRASELRYRNLIEQASDAIFTADHEGNFLDINSKALEMLGYNREELLQLSVRDIMSNEDQDKLAVQWEETLYAGNTLRVERRMRRKDGTFFHVESSSKMLDDGRLQAIVRDITERKRADEQILFQAQVLDQVQAAVIATDMQGTITHWNRYAEKLYGWQREDALGLPIRSLLVGPTDADLANEIMTQVMAEDSWEGEFTVRRKDGSTFPAYVVDTLIRDLAGRSTGIAGISVDMTERKRAEEELRASEEKFRAIFENILDAVFITDDEARFVNVNQAASKLIGLPIEKLVGNSFADFQNLNATAELSRLQGEVAERGEAIGELQFASANGEIKDVEYFTIANFIPGYHLSVAHDLTERKRAEEASMDAAMSKRANLAKSEFLSRMSHELRTPLNAILGFGQLLQMDSTTLDQQESVGYILKAGQHLLSLIDEVLDISRIEEGKLTISIEPVFVRDVLQESLNLVQPLAARRNIEVKADLEWMESYHVMADHQRLQQVMLNLLANAIKYNRDGGLVNVSCSELSYEVDGAQQREDAQALQASKAPARLRIAVSDTGPGLSPDKVARLFTPFDRLGAEQGDVEGTGLGLALSKHLVEAMGGAIGVESQQDMGSTFWVELVTAEGQMPRLELMATGSLANILEGEQARTILYIEDNLSNLRLIQRILRKQPGINLITAMQGQMGLDMAYEHQADLILLDLHLPDMTGDEVLRRLREEPRTASIPVVVLSADANPRRVDELLEAGAQAYLTKPLDVKQVLKVLEETIGRTTG